MPTFHLLKEHDSISAASVAAELVVTRLSQALETTERPILVVAGGSSFIPVYQQLAADTSLDWARVLLIFGDERCVPADDERSNFRMVREAWLDRVTGALPEVCRMRGELPVEEGVVHYTRILGEIGHGQAPTPTLVLLGVGSDGHTASVFPGSLERLLTIEAPVAWTEAELDPRVHRLTLTPGYLTRAEATLVLATGESKADILERVLSDNSESYPISKCLSKTGNNWLIGDQMSLENVK